VQISAEAFHTFSQDFMNFVADCKPSRLILENRYYTAGQYGMAGSVRKFADDCHETK